MASRPSSSLLALALPVLLSLIAACELGADEPPGPGSTPDASQAPPAHELPPDRAGKGGKAGQDVKAVEAIKAIKAGKGGKGGKGGKAGNGGQVAPPPGAGRPSGDSTGPGGSARANAVFRTAFDSDGNAKGTERVMDHAESPDAIRLTRAVGSYRRGSVLLYYVDFSEFGSGSDKTSAKMVSSTDGVNFGSPKTVSLDDKSIEAGHIADASVVQLESGELRIYFMNTIKGNEREATIYSATSSDGVNFEMDDGIRITSTDNVEVVRAGDTWFMFMSNYRTDESAVATSSDGLTWTKASNKTVPGSGIGACENDGQIEVFTHSGTNVGLVTYGFNERTSTADERDKETWVSHGGVADVSPVLMSDGSYIVYYKRGMDK